VSQVIPSIRHEYLGTVEAILIGLVRGPAMVVVRDIGAVPAPDGTPVVLAPGDALYAAEVVEHQLLCAVTSETSAGPPAVDVELSKPSRKRGATQEV
jgi:hypothetical protein